ncbi:predicted protein [Arabidopsis lyrata subsp. lyrata]|uniref:Predicted protein n=1 Tax=Arabidopsis lyrata subsp. lyrata TaxID=81972 RepID=D7M127_ARALL|nr:predicted protein [Arabidopsis lyrata subsp. lyrata]
MDDNNRRIKDKNYLTATTIFYPTAAMIGDRVLRGLKPGHTSLVYSIQSHQPKEVFYKCGPKTFLLFCGLKQMICLLYGWAGPG